MFPGDGRKRKMERKTLLENFLEAYADIQALLLSIAGSVIAV